MGIPGGEGRMKQKKYFKQRLGISPNLKSDTKKQMQEVKRIPSKINGQKQQQKQQQKNYTEIFHLQVEKIRER